MFKYTPKTDEEMFGIMNMLEDRLISSSSQVILDSIKVFINYASLSKDEAMVNSVIKRI